MNKIGTTVQSQTISTHIEQPVSVPEVGKEDLTTNFYIIGGVINITMITAYFIWAFYAWKKTDKRKKQ
jgi:hypothetical protein